MATTIKLTKEQINALAMDGDEEDRLRFLAAKEVSVVLGGIGGWWFALNIGLAPEENYGNKTD